ncbi:MAG: GNAT family N-acetyltransferase [Sphingomicrobium sp.]|nr:bifunctional helix-turn-helix transcriptional regulator/GNAT family N-acetyltransferase [Sphingomonadales bacterium]
MADAIAEIRAFNRFYTRFVGALDQGHLDSDFSLTEVRVLYELANEDAILAKEVGRRLGLDPGYLSRMFKRFEAGGFINRGRTKRDGRAAALSLTKAGRELFDELDSRAASQVSEAIEPLDRRGIRQITSAMQLIRALLDPDSEERRSGKLKLRTPRSGDFGWAIERHGILYFEEKGWGPAFEGLVAELFGAFARKHDPARERCWIAELDGERVGCVFVVERDVDIAQLRCLLVEPSARGHGVGAALVGACTEFAREAGYLRMMLWTNKGLDSARKIYEAAGFRLIEEEPHQDFGPALIGQNWEMQL